MVLLMISYEPGEYDNSRQLQHRAQKTQLLVVSNYATVTETMVDMLNVHLSEVSGAVTVTSITTEVFFPFVLLSKKSVTRTRFHP